MKNKIIYVVILALVILSCSKEKDNLPPGIKEGKGTIWLSGGLAFCAQQIRMDQGDTLIVVNEAVLIPFRSGYRVNVRYQETEENETNCSIGIDCEIIDIEKIN